jgi:hypothetical protein
LGTGYEERAIGLFMALNHNNEIKAYDHKRKCMSKLVASFRIREIFASHITIKIGISRI